MPASRRSALAFVAISIAFAPLGTQACMAYQRSPASFARGRAEIRVRFAEPRPLAIARTGAPTAHVAAASELDGRTFGTRGDTIYLEPTRVVLAGRELPGLTLGAWTTIVLREGDRLEVRRPAPGRVVARVFGAIALLWFLFVITYDEAT
jgi:hypothetical protein